MGQREAERVRAKRQSTNLSIYIPKGKMPLRPVRRLLALGQKRDRSLNYLVVEAISQYLDREEKRAAANLG